MKNTTQYANKWWIFVGVGIASFLGCIDFTIVNTALPAIETGLATTVVKLQWIINMFILTLSSFMVMMGRLADLYGRRRVLYAGLVLFGLSSLGAGLALNIDMLIAFRFLQGMACAILYTATGAIVSHAFPPQEQGRAMGALFSVNAVGLAIGSVLGGVIVAVLGWRWVFLVNIPVIVMSFLICWCYVTESKSDEADRRIDWLGLITLLGALPILILAITEGPFWGWGSALTLAAFILAIILLVVFYQIEMRAPSPIIQFHLFINHQFIGSVIASAALAFFYCVAFFLMPLYLHKVLHAKSMQIGLMLMPTTLTITCLSPLAGKIVDRYGAKIPLVMGLLLLALSALLQSHFNGATSFGFVLIAFIIMGMGWSGILAPSTTAALASVPNNMAGVAMGSSWTVHNIGGAIGLAMGVAAYHAQSEMYHSFIAGYQAAMQLLIASSLAAFILVIFVMQGRKR